MDGQELFQLAMKHIYGGGVPKDNDLAMKLRKIWDGFFVLAKLNEGRRSSATLTGMKHCQGEKGAHRFNILDGI